jgi:hypothetical protein
MEGIMASLIRKSPLVFFFYVAVVLTQSSLLFPQSLGSFQRVAGWPLVMHKTQYKIQGKIEQTGSIVHNIKEESKQIMWGRVLLNIVIWTAILQGTWIGYYKLLDRKTGKLAGSKI